MPFSSLQLSLTIFHPAFKLLQESLKRISHTSINKVYFLLNVHQENSPFSTSVNTLSITICPSCFPFLSNCQFQVRLVVRCFYHVRNKSLKDQSLHRFFSFSENRFISHKQPLNFALAQKYWQCCVCVYPVFYCSINYG